MGNRKASSIPSMMSGNDIYNTDEEKAKLFNDYFVDVQSLPEETTKPYL